MTFRILVAIPLLASAAFVLWGLWRNTPSRWWHQ